MSNPVEKKHSIAAAWWACRLGDCDRYTVIRCTGTDSSTSGELFNNGPDFSNASDNGESDSSALSDTKYILSTFSGGDKEAGITIDNHGVVYVSDQGNHRIIKLTPRQ
jgi:hypothetical protein